MPILPTDWNVDASGNIQGPLGIGMPVCELKVTLGSNFSAFRRTTEADNRVWAFDKHSIHVVVDECESQVVGLVLFAPNRVALGGVQLLGQRTAWLHEALAALGHEFELRTAGLWSTTLGIFLVDVEGTIDGVEIGNSG